MSDETAAGHELLEHVLALELEVTNTETIDFDDDAAVRITMKEDPEILASCAFGLIFAIGVLSFHQARPRGVSELGGYEDDDQWTVADMLRDLRFEGGRLRFYADYVRGRLMKTSVDISPDGTIVLETRRRGTAATRWVARLQGKKLMSLVEGPTLNPEPDLLQ